MTDLKPVLHALGYTSEMQQRDFIKLLAASGAFDELPGVEGTLSDKQAQAILNAVTFGSAEEAAKWLHEITQDYMLRRPPGAERWDCEEPEFFRLNRGELLNALHHLGALAEVKPKEKHYDHVLVLGGMEGATSTRLDTVGELYDQGVRFDNIHLLGSERGLNPQYEPLASVATDVGAVATEMQMMIARAYEKSETSWPEGLQNIKLNPVTTPNQAHGRANTRDTAVSWLDWMKKNNKPLKGSVLVISSQPNVAYQDAAVKAVLPKEFTVETVGARIGEDGLKITIAMDAIARQIDVGMPKLLEALKTAQQPKPEFIMIDPAELKVDAASYQFRSGGDKNGVTKKRKGSDHWDPILDSDPLLVHNGYIVDGHHRRDKAVALNAKGIGPGKVAAIVLGPEYSKQDAKIVGAFKNIAHELAHHNSDPVDIADAARTFKEAEKLPADHQKLLPHLKLEGDIKIAYTMRGLSDTSIDMVAKGHVPAGAAAAVAEKVTEPERQDSVMRIISAKLHQNYDNYMAQTILSGGYETHTHVQRWSLDARNQPQSLATESSMAGFLAKLQQQRGGAVSVLRIS